MSHAREEETEQCHSVRPGGGVQVSVRRRRGWQLELLHHRAQLQDFDRATRSAWRYSAGSVLHHHRRR
eukprot:scaffold1590_cov239-Pinguiococcus_pyrenoidosus.AAC.3